jgi:cyclic beta-1,2-glucan synthetase
MDPRDVAHRSVRTQAWSSFDVIFRYHSARHHITVENPRGISRGIARAELDGVALAGNSGHVPLADDGVSHRARVLLG